MKAYELLEGKSSAYIAKAQSQGYNIKVRITRSKSRNSLNTYNAEIKVIARGERWIQCHWFDCRDEVDQVLAAVQEKFPHIAFEKEIKTVDYAAPRKKAKKQKTAYYIKTSGEVGQPRTVKTNKPLFEIV